MPNTSDISYTTTLFIDPQTSLPTLSRLYTDLSTLLDSQTPLTLIVCGLNNVPAETHDSASANVIGNIARVIGKAVPDSCKVHLYHSAYDSFVLVLPDTERAAGLELAEQIRRDVEHMGGGITATLIVGGTPEDGNEASALLAACEAQLLAHDAEQNCVRSAVPVASLPAATVRLVHLLKARLVALVELGEHLRIAEQQATHDLITGLPNARSLEQILPRLLERHAHSNTPLTLVLVDGDNLKDYNERYGYAAGNEWIRSVAQILAGNLRPDDYVARWMMGDEFVVLLPDTTHETAQRIIERLRSAVETAGYTTGYPGTISIGAVIVQGAVRAEAALEQARNVLVDAKQRGKNQANLVEMVGENYSLTSKQ